MKHFTFVLAIILQVPFSSSEEWVVSDDKSLDLGVPQNMSYVQGPCGPGCLESVPGCPKSIDGNPWVYFGNPRRCYLTGILSIRGPCGRKRVLGIIRCSRIGKCMALPRPEESHKSQELVESTKPQESEELNKDEKKSQELDKEEESQETLASIRVAQVGRCRHGWRYSRTLRRCLVSQARFKDDVGR